MQTDTPLEDALRRDRWLVLSLLAAVIVGSCAYVLSGAGMGMSAFETTRTSGTAESMAGAAVAPAGWSPGHAAVLFIMWWTMMVAMMLPSAAPMILLFAAVNRRRRHQGNPYASTSLFTCSYLVAWAGFSLSAAGLHWFLDRAGLISPGMDVTSQLLAACLLVAAGLYQLTPIKQACLRHCRMPVAYLAEHWRPGTRGAFVMGLQHGAYCLGCCWFLMSLLFFGGVMNLYWIAGLALYVLLEKTVQAGRWLSYGTGLVLVIAGSRLLLASMP